MATLPSVLLPLLLLAGAAVDHAAGWLGVMLTADDQGRPVVTEVIPDSPAEKAGVAAGDVVLAVGDTATPTTASLIEAVGPMKTGAKVKLWVLRDGKKTGLDVVLGQRPSDLEGGGAGGGRVQPPPIEQKEPPKVAKPAPKEAKGRPYVGVALEESDAGLRVVEVKDDSPAEKAGVKAGFMLKKVGDREVSSLSDLDAVMAKLSPGETVTMVLQAGDRVHSVKLQLGAAGKAPARPAGERAGDDDDDDEAAERMEKAKAQAKEQAAKAKAAAKAQAEKAKAQAKLMAEKAKAAEKAHADAKKVAAESGRVRTLQPSGGLVLRAGDGQAAAGAIGRSGTGTLMVFGAEWDASTKALRKALSSDDVKKAMGDLNMVFVDTDKNGNLADRFDVDEIPHLVILDANGRRRGQSTGYVAPDKLVETLGKWSDELAAAKAEAGSKSEPKAKPAKAKPEKAEAKGDDDDLEQEIRELREEIRALREALKELNRGRGR